MKIEVTNTQRLMLVWMIRKRVRELAAELFDDSAADLTETVSELAELHELLLRLEEVQE